MKRPGILGEEGTSLTELAVTVVIAGMTLAAITLFLAKSQRGLLNAENRATLLSANQRISANLRQSILGTVGVLADPPGSSLMAYHRSLILQGISSSASQAPPPVSFSLAAKKQIVDTVDKVDPANIGNELSLLVSLQPLTLTVKECVSCTAADNAPEHVVSVDRFQVLHLYLAATARSVPGAGPAMRLVEWRSIPYASFASFSGFSGARLSETCKSLAEKGYSLALDADEFRALNGCFYSLSPSGQPYSPAPPPSSFPEGSWAYADEFKIAMDRDPDPLRPRGRVNLHGAFSGIAAFRSTYSVAYNTLSPTVNPELKVHTLVGQRGDISVPHFALADRDSKAGFPGGLEVAVLGKPGSRQIYLGRVMLAASAALDKRGPEAFLAHEVVDYVSIGDRY